MRVADEFKEVDDLLYDLIEYSHESILKGGFFDLVPVDFDARVFCANAMGMILAVRRGYIREYEKRHKDASPNRLDLYSLEKIAFVYIKCILHVQVFTVHEINIKEFIRKHGKDAYSHLVSPNAHFAAEFIVDLYQHFCVRDATALTLYFKYVHIKDVFKSLVILFERAKDDWSSITPEFIAYVCYAIRLSHKSVTARTTTKLLARDGLMPLVEEWVSIYKQLWLIYVDVDHFSQVISDNDQEAGNKCLNKIADLVHDFATMSRGACERHGGNEFVIVSPVSSGVDLDSYLDDLLKNIRLITRPNHDKTDAVKYKSYMSATIAYGTIDSHRFDSHSFRSTYDRAMNWLEQAVVNSKKDDKRNRIIHL